MESADQLYSHMKNADQKVETVIKTCRHQFHKKTTVGFERANWDQAVSNKKKRCNRYYKDQEVNFGVDLHHFKMYGTGIYLFFAFHKQIIILFLLLSLIGTIPILYNFFNANKYINVGDGYQVYIASASIGNHSNGSITDKLLNVIPDMVGCMIFFFFILYWQNKSNQLIQEVKKQVKLASYCAVQITDFPLGINQEDIQKFINNFGVVTQVAAVRDYSERIQLSKEIFGQSLAIKQIQLTLNSQNQDRLEKQTLKKEQKIQKLYKQLTNQENMKQAEIIKFFVTFKSPVDRDKVVELFAPYQGFCRCCYPQIPKQLLLQDDYIRLIKSNTQPGGIIWQNMHIGWKTRWMRVILQYLLLLIIIIIGFLLIILLKVSSPPLKNNSIDTTNYTSNTIQQQTNILIIQSWCLKNLQASSSNENIKFLCQQYIIRYYLNIVISIGVACGIVVVKLLIKFIVIFLVKFQRYKTHTEQSLSITRNLFITYTFTTILITILLQNRIWNISLKQIIRFALLNDQKLLTNLQEIKQYSNFNSQWYLDIGDQIWFTVLILAFSPHCIMPIYHFISEKIGEWKGKDEVLQKNMENRIEAEQFQIEDHYATSLLLITVSYVFSGGIPSLLFLGFLGICTRYIYMKYVFIRYCRVPKTFDESLNHQAIFYMALTLFIHFLISILMYGVQQIFLPQESFFGDYITANFGISSIVILLQSFIYTWYMSGLFIILLIIYLLQELIINFLLKIRNSDTKKNKALSIMLKVDDNGNKSYADNLRSQKSLTTSYKMQNNPDYFQILAIMSRQKLNIDNQL